MKNLCNEINIKTTDQFQSIWAVVVSYCDGESLVKTVHALRGQVDQIHIVDNASTEPSLSIAQRLAELPGVSLERLKRNMGIGYALNCGAMRARSAGATWLLTMDQDSIVDSNMIKTYSEAIAKDASLVSLSPAIHNHGCASAGFDVELDFAITSGNMIRLDLLQRVGGFDEGFFIDGVDIDVSLRIRALGVRIKRVNGAILHHELGCKHAATGPLSRFYIKHSPTRLYYIYRNHLLLLRRHAFSFPLFMLKATLVQCLHFAALVRFENDLKQSMRAVWAGIRAGLEGQIGPRP